MDVDLVQLRSLALDVATAAATQLMAGRARQVTVAATKSSATDVVTEMDRASERLIVDRILAARPDDGLLGEEAADRVGTSGIRWVIDPLDGTVNYLYGLPSWAVSVAVEQQRDGAGGAGGAGGEVLVGVVAVPTLGETYAAVRGAGAYLHTADGQEVRLQVTDPVPLDRALVGTGFGYRADRRRRQGAVVARLLPRVRDVRRAGACATDLCHLAAGRLDGFYEVGPQLWDHAAAGLVAREAGAVVALEPVRDEPDPLVVAAGPYLFPRLRETLLDLHR